MRKLVFRILPFFFPPLLAMILCMVAAAPSVAQVHLSIQTWDYIEHWDMPQPQGVPPLTQEELDELPQDHTVPWDMPQPQGVPPLTQEELDELPYDHTVPWNVPLTQEEMKQQKIQATIDGLTQTKKFWNDYADDEGGAGGSRRFFKDWINPGVDFILGSMVPDNLKALEGLPKLRDWVDERAYEDNAKAYRRKRDFEVRETLETTASKIVNNSCKGNILCAEEYFDRMLNDPKLQKELSRADALGAFDEAQTRAYVKAAIRTQIEAYKGTIGRIDDLEATILEAYQATSDVLVQGFAQVNANQEQIMKNNARIIYTQQNHTIALKNLQNTMDLNFVNIAKGIDNVVKLQQKNLFLSGAILEGVVVANKNLEIIHKNLSEMHVDVRKIRATQLQNVFINSPISQRIEMLTNMDSEYYKLFEKNDDERLAILENLKAIKLQQDIVNAANLVSRWGNVATTALNTFCESCPQELSKGIQIGVTTANIVGNITTGNYAGAALSAIGLFGEPETSPELKMLTQISGQLRRFEQNMNEQFRNVHEHLFSIEENLGRRIDILDLKIDQLTREVIISRIKVLEALSGIDASLNYIIHQNECQKNILLTLANQQGQEMCKIPAREFQSDLVAGRFSSFQDLENFFRGGSCAGCIKAIFNVSNIEIQDAAFFRYSECQIEGTDNKARPDRAYEFIYHKLLGDARNDPVLITALALPPRKVTQVDEVLEFVKSEPAEDRIELGAEDRYYRNPQAVMTFANYILTLFPFMELHDDGKLVTPAMINGNPGFTTERSRKMIVLLRDLRGLLTRTQVQQSLMSGHAMMDMIDSRLQSGDNVFFGQLEGVFFSLSDLFRYNPYLRKNYSAYILDRAIGYRRLSRLIESGQINASPQRVAFHGYSLLLESKTDDEVIFSASLTNRENPTASIPLFSVSIPLINGKIGKQAYQDYLSFAIPVTMIEIERMRRAVTEKLGEMYMVTVDELHPELEFTRADLENLVKAFARRNRTN